MNMNRVAHPATDIDRIIGQKIPFQTSLPVRFEDRNIGAKVSNLVSGKRKIPWRITCVVMDGADRVEKAEIPLKEAISFIERFSKFRIELKIIETAIGHDYMPVYNPETGFTSYNMLRDDIPLAFRQSLPVSENFLFLFQMFGRPPQLAGSTMGVPDGILSGGLMRPYATVPVDLWWYHNFPEGGFLSRAASILAHELINTINCVTADAPWLCTPMVGALSPDPYITEQNRLRALPEACYAKLRNGIISIE